MNKNRIQREIEKVENKQFEAILNTVGAVLFGYALKAVCGVVLFFVANFFYFRDNYFYITVDRFSESVSDKISMVIIAICAFTAFKFYGYYKEKRALKRVLKRRKREE